MNYKKKPITVQAIKFTRENWDEIIAFTNGTAHTLKIEKRINGECTCIIPTLEGEHIAKEGDYIIKGIKGEFYPCKPDIFVQSYTLSEKQEKESAIEFYAGKLAEMFLDTMDGRMDTTELHEQGMKLIYVTKTKAIQEMVDFGNFCRIHDQKHPNEVWTTQQLYDKYQEII